MPGEIGKPPGELSATVKNVLEGTYAGGKKLTGQDLANALEKVQRKTALRKAVEKMFGKAVKTTPKPKSLGAAAKEVPPAIEGLEYLGVKEGEPTRHVFRHKITGQRFSAANISKERLNQIRDYLQSPVGRLETLSKKPVSERWDSSIWKKRGK